MMLGGLEAMHCVLLHLVPTLKTCICVAVFEQGPTVLLRAG